MRKRRWAAQVAWWEARTLSGCLAWTTCAGRREGRKAGGPRRGPWTLV